MGESGSSVQPAAGSLQVVRNHDGGRRPPVPNGGNGGDAGKDAPPRDALELSDEARWLDAACELLGRALDGLAPLADPAARAELELGFEAGGIPTVDDAAARIAAALIAMTASVPPALREPLAREALERGLAAVLRRLDADGSSGAIAAALQSAADGAARRLRASR